MGKIKRFCVSCGETEYLDMMDAYNNWVRHNLINKGYTLSELTLSAYVMGLVKRGNNVGTERKACKG